MSWPALCAAAATVVVLWLSRPPGRWIIRVRLGSGTTRRAGLRRTVGRPERLGLAAGVVGVGVATSRISFVIVAGTVVGAALFVLRQVGHARSRSASLQTRARVIAALELLAAELRAGILPHQAIEALADDAPVLRPAAAAAAHGGDVAAALQAASTEPGAGALADLAGAWHVAERAGAPLADVLDRVATAARDEAEVDRDVQAEAAPARATGRLMAVLPVLGLSLGAGMGADPVHILTGTVIGATCLAAGVALACAGIAWVDRIVATVDAA